MLEKFYFESFLISFSAFCGAIISYFLNWIIDKSKMSLVRKIIVLIVILFFSILSILFILFVIIYIIGLSSNGFF